ncbi:MAG: hypothetical protein GF417_08875 [Candidatus Latescibacteria bacterium]|nr:hypothetical protein [bacterium]MBD3424535.1 hypothetical protein [Candidatus Latescibacterota bacterium]
MSAVYKLLACGVISITFLFFVEAEGTEADSPGNKLRPSSLDTLSLDGNLSYTPEQLKESIKKTQQRLIDAVSCLPGTLYQNLDLDTMSFEELYNRADMDFFNSVKRDTYIQGVVRFLKLLNLKDVEYNVWVPVVIGVEVGYPFFLEYRPEEGEIGRSLKPGTIPPSNKALCGDLGEGDRAYQRIRDDLVENGGYLHKIPLVQRGDLNQ